jgi:hypothetical protein
VIIQDVAVAGTKKEAEKKKAVWDKKYSRVTIRKVKTKDGIRHPSTQYGKFFYQVIAWVD